MTLAVVVDLADLAGLEVVVVADWERQDKNIYMHSYHYPHHLPIDLESLP